MTASVLLRGQTRLNVEWSTTGIFTKTEGRWVSLPDLKGATKHTDGSTLLKPPLSVNIGRHAINPYPGVKPRSVIVKIHLI